MVCSVVIISSSDAEDNQNVLGLEDVNLSVGSSPEESSSDTGSPSDHGLPPTTTRSRKRKNSDKYDDDFIPSELESSRNERMVSKKFSASTAAKRGATLTHEVGSSVQGDPKPKPKKARSMTIYLKSRKATVFVDPHVEVEEEEAVEEEEEAPQSPQPRKRTNLMQDAMPRSPVKTKSAPKGKGKAVAASFQEKRRLLLLLKRKKMMTLLM